MSLSDRIPCPECSRVVQRRGLHGHRRFLHQNRSGEAPSVVGENRGEVPSASRYDRRYDFGQPDIAGLADAADRYDRLIVEREFVPLACPNCGSGISAVVLGGDGSLKKRGNTRFRGIFATAFCYVCKIHFLFKDPAKFPPRWRATQAPIVPDRPNVIVLDPARVRLGAALDVPPDHDRVRVIKTDPERVRVR